jgi:hypothetical protein
MKTKQASSVTNYRNINIKRIIANDLIFNSPRDLVRFKALQCRESGSWLHAIPSPNIGTLLDNTSFQVCIGLRLGSNLCTPHICKRNAQVDEIGTHGLSCFKSSGRFSRQTEINSIINRSLTSIHVNSTLEPNGLSRDDRKHECQKRPNLHTTELNTTFFLFDEPLKGSKSLKTFKISLTFRFDKLTFIKIRSHRRKFSNSDSVEQKNILKKS